MNLADFLKGTGIKAVFYGRHSTDEQNVETQLHVSNEFARKHGIAVIDKYVDESVSAFKKTMDKRKYLDKLRKDAKERKFDCVLVYKADRLARRVDQHMQLWGEFRELGIPIIITSSEKLYTTDSPTDIIVEIGLSSLEAENTRVRTRDSYNRSTVEGKWLGGNLPYGFEYGDNESGDSEIKPIPEKVKDVENVFKLYKRGYGFKRIADILNKEANNLNEKSRNWVSETVKSIITNPFYAGYTTSQRIIHGSGNSINDRSNWKMGKCEKIPEVITIEEWEECMLLYEKKKDGSVDQHKYITPYLFRDVLFCEVCDERLLGKNYTSGKKRKDGTSYGGRVYLCKNCKRKWDAPRLEKELIVQVLEGWYYQFFNNNDGKLHQEVMNRIQGDIDKINKEIELYKQELSVLIVKIHEVELKQKKLMEKNPEPDELQFALVQYRISNQKKIEQYKKLICIKEKDKQQLYLSYVDGEKFKNSTFSLTDFSFKLKDPELRKLILFLLDKVNVSGEKNYNYEITAKVDLNQRGHIYIGF